MTGTQRAHAGKTEKRNPSSKKDKDREKKKTGKSRGAGCPSGFRAPKRSEITGVSRYMGSYYHVLKKQAMASGAFFLACGVLFFAGCAVDLHIPALFFGAVSLIAAAAAFIRLRRFADRESLFAEGRFSVLDGSVSERIPEPDGQGTFSVGFVSRGGRTVGGLFKVKQEGLGVGTPLLLIYIPKEDFRGESFVRVFTPFMLTGKRTGKHR